MSQEAQQTAMVKADEKSVRYIPFGGKDQIELSIGMVKKFLATPTKSGKIPDDREIVKFMMLCQARELNPWEGDAYLVGYDSQNGPQFSMITAHQSLLKRAEACIEFDGMESGIIVKNQAGEIQEIVGDFIYPGCTLVGGWAKVYRKDRRFPMVSRLNISVYDTQRSRWAKDPAGMIVKCAEADAMRRSFPNKLSKMYVEGEREPVDSYADVPPISGANGNGSVGPKAAALKQELQKRAEKQQPPQPTADDQGETETVVTEVGDTVEVVTGEVVAEQAPEPKNEAAPYPDNWPDRRKTEKPKGYAMTWGDTKTATPKFLDKLRKDKSDEAIFEMRYRLAQGGADIPKDEKLYEALVVLTEKK